MIIQWFPGHMTKALREMDESAKLIDVFGYVLDARAPQSCFNPSFENVIGNKPCVFILNKCDLADDKKTAEWCSYFEKSGQAYVKVSATVSGEAGKIVSAFEKLAEPLRQKYKAKNIVKPVRCMILGVPNSGKSTIINCIAGKKTVITGDRPGVTKGKQWVRLSSGLELLDTPGTLWPKFDDQKTACHLAYVGSIKDEVLDTVELACELIGELQTVSSSATVLRYNVENVGASFDVFTQIAQKRGFVMRGSEIDNERTATAILDDFRKGKLGKITLDSAKI